MFTLVINFAVIQQRSLSPNLASQALHDASAQLNRHRVELISSASGQLGRPGTLRCLDGEGMMEGSKMAWSVGLAAADMRHK